MSDAPASKEAVVLKLLEEGDTMLCLDARHQDVCVPPQHAKNPDLRLILNLNFPRPIEVHADGIGADLAFGGRRFSCYIPMAALWAAFNPETQQGMMWPDSMPDEVRHNLAAKQQQEDTQGTASSKAPKPPQRPRVVAGTGKATAEKNDDTQKPPRQRGHLRVVK